MSKHTALPWERGEYDEHLGYDCMTGGVRIGPVVLDARDYGQKNSWGDKPWDRDRMEADARLIESIHDLLEALKGLTAHLGPDGYLPGPGKPATDKALAAIARAEDAS